LPPQVIDDEPMQFAIVVDEEILGSRHPDDKIQSPRFPWSAPTDKG
jgi:hypothetical protein